MVVAYAAARAAAPGHLVLYRVGESYEALGDDAATVSRLLGIQLTRRRQKDAPDIPMCGIPAGTAEASIARLLAPGCKVAVSEQPAEPAGERPLRLMTPGTSVDADVSPPAGPTPWPWPAPRARRSPWPGPTCPSGRRARAWRPSAAALRRWPVACSPLLRGRVHRHTPGLNIQ